MTLECAGEEKQRQGAQGLTLFNAIRGVVVTYHRNNLVGTRREAIEKDFDEQIGSVLAVNTCDWIDLCLAAACYGLIGDLDSLTACFPRVCGQP